jgi:SEC-C motif/Phage integrase, N-terminal SAM-like domain
VINLTLKRNDPCPCGSGKKYKKCCLNKENIMQMQEVKEDRFFQSKHKLVLKLRDFLIKQISPSSYYRQQSDFIKRSQHALAKNIEDGFFDFWLFFFNRFENGLRGIEWFINENSHLLSNEEKQQADIWQSLTPKIVQAINTDNEIIHFEDVFTKEQYQVPVKKENVTSFLPWYGTIALLEPFNDLFYFNGVRVFEDPNGVYRAVKKVEELMETTNLSREQILFDYYPEILAVLIKDQEREDETREILEYTVEYEVQDEQALSQFVHGQEQFTIDRWDKNDKRCSWAGNWYQYTDNQISEPIFMAEVHGKLFVDNHLLQFISLEQARVDEYKQMVQPLITSNTLVLRNEKSKTIKIPFHAEIRDMMFSTGNGIPQYFALYAQNDIRFGFDKPIRQFNGLTINELITSGRKSDAENWLKQMEYNMYYQVKQQFKQVEVTADYNTIRKELGLPLSPFVTGGDKRESTFVPLATPNQQENQPTVNEKDISTYEELGFTNETINRFFADDVVAFFKDKTAGKSENTVRKYRSSLYDLVMIFDNYELESWDRCDHAFWERICVIDFLGRYEYVNKTAIKDFLSTIKALAKWLDKEKKSTSLSKIVTQVAKDVEEPMLMQLK